MLAKISIGWVWLERTLNGIIDAVNQQKPLGSASVAVEESPNGSLLKVVGQQQQTDGQTGGGPTEGHWVAVQVMDDNCNKSTLYVWAKQ